MPRRILAERNGRDVLVWFEGDDIKSVYHPETLGYRKWAALADRLARENEAA